MLGIFNRRLLTLCLVLILTAIILACGEEATPTAEPVATQAAVDASAQAATTAAAPTSAAPAPTTAAVAPTPTATPTAAPDATVPAPTPQAMMEPTGSLSVGMAEVAPAQHILHLQTYSALKYDVLLTHEPMFRRDKAG